MHVCVCVCVCVVMQLRLCLSLVLRLFHGCACDPRSPLVLATRCVRLSPLCSLQFAVCMQRWEFCKAATESGATEAPRLRIPHLVTLWSAGPVAPVLSGVFAQYCTGVFAQYYVLRSIMCSVWLLCIVASLYYAIRRIMARAPYCLEVLCRG